MADIQKRVMVLIFVLLFASGCATTTKTSKQPNVLQGPLPAVEEQLPPKTPPITNIEGEIQNVPLQEAELDIPAAIQIPTETAAPSKITYLQITNLINEFLDIEPVEAASGQPRYIGTSENKLVTLELIGDKDNIAIATMKLIYPKDIEPVNVDLNNAMMLRFLKNVAPDVKEWSNNVKDITSRLYSMQLGQTKEEEISLQDKLIKILYDRNSSSITVTAKTK